MNEKKFSPLVPSDAVIVIMASLGAGKKIPSSRGVLHDLFCSLSETFPSVFMDYVFDDSSYYSYCEIVKIAVEKMEKFGWVEWRSSDTGNYTILPALVEKGKELFELFSESDKIVLGKVADKLKEMIGAK